MSHLKLKLYVSATICFVFVIFSHPYVRMSHFRIVRCKSKIYESIWKCPELSLISNEYIENICAEIEYLIINEKISNLIW